MKYGKIHHQFWTWARANNLSDTVIVFAAYLLTNEHSNTAGLYKLGRLYVCDDLGCSLEDCNLVYDELENIDFIKYCSVTKYVFIQKYLKWNPPQNKNHGVFIAKIIEELPSYYSHYVTLKERLEKYRSKHIPDTLYNTLSHRVSHRVQEGFKNEGYPIGYDIPYGISNKQLAISNKKTLITENSDQISKTENDKNGKGGKRPSQNYKKLFDEFWETYPRKVGKNNAIKAYKKIQKIEETHPVIIEAIQLQKLEKKVLLENDRFCPEWPHPATWLNGGRWMDEVEVDLHLQISDSKKNTEWTPPWSEDEIPNSLDPEEMRKIREEKLRRKKD